MGSVFSVSEASEVERAAAAAEERLLAVSIYSSCADTYTSLEAA